MRHHHKLMTAFTVMMTSLNSYAVSQHTDVAHFFEQYQHLYQKFDPDFISLFSNDAEMTNTTYGEDFEVFTTFRGKKLATHLEDILKYANVVHAADSYSNIKIEALNDQQYVLTAHRYEIDYCYTDKEFKLTLQRQESGQLQIIQYHDSSIEVPLCTTSLEVDIPAKIKVIAAAENRTLPKFVDRETIHERVEAKDNVLTYVYSYPNHRLEDLDTEEMKNYESLTREAQCKNKMIYHDIQSGILYRYLTLTSDQEVAMDIKLDKSVCDQYQ